MKNLLERIGGKEKLKEKILELIKNNLEKENYSDEEIEAINGIVGFDIYDFVDGNIKMDFDNITYVFAALGLHYNLIPIPKLNEKERTNKKMTDLYIRTEILKEL